MRKLIILLSLNFVLLTIAGQSVKISYNDLNYFKDTIDFELKDGLQDGTYKAYFDKDDKNLAFEGEIKSQMKVGTWKWYYESGNKKREASYSGGIIDGEETYYYDNGQKCVSMSYTFGKINNSSTGWYLNGNKQFEGTYSNGLPVGAWRFYNEDGTIYREEEY